MHFWGLCYYHSHQVVSLPLLHVNAAVTIKDLAAQVKLTQTFTNDAGISIEAVYTFPVPARATVSGFTLVKQDGARVLGVVQEKAEAKKTYEKAVSEGKLASLMVEQTPDVFQVSVGNILSKEKVTIELLYSTELTEDEENDSIRFLLPSHIGARYGQAPSSYVQSQALDVHVAISVESLSPIRKISCPSHAVSVELGPDPAVAQDLPFSNYARVSLASDSALNKDFVLAIEATGLDSPRCLAEVHPTNDTVGLALTLVPKFSLLDPSTQEFIFLVDRSGSMQGSRIAAARKALVIMLRSLPRKNTFFQIVSFGTNASSLWHEGSRLYDQESLEEATRHVDSMQANFGGTEIRRALDSCFEKRIKFKPTSIFLLTDGDAWDLAGVLEAVKEKVLAAVQTKSSYLRVFTLGIGDSASTAMCEGIARMGNGASMMVGEKEATMTGKIARLLKAARTPPISDLSIDWGRDDDSQTLAEDEFEGVSHEKVEKPKSSFPKKFNIFNQAVNPLKGDDSPVPPVAQIVLGPPARVQESPNKLENLFPGVRAYVYAILQGKSTLPQMVIIRGKTPDGSEIELPVPVTLSRLPGTTAVHSLAARKIIQDLEDGRYDEAVKSNVTADLARVVKAHIVRLGKTYSISSKYTSFVAVDESSSKERGSSHRSVPHHRQARWAPPTPYSFSSAGGTYSSYAAVQAPTMARLSMSGSNFQSVPQSYIQSYDPTVESYDPTISDADDYGGQEEYSVAPRRRSVLPQSRGQNLVLPQPDFGPALKDQGLPEPRAAKRLSRAFGSLFRRSSTSSNQPSSFRGNGKTASPVDLSTKPAIAALTASPVVQPSTSDLSATSASISSPIRDAWFNGDRASNMTDPLEVLARLQSFDGGFTMQILDVIKLKEKSVRAAFPRLQDTVIATVLAMAFIATKLKDRQTQDVEAWKGIYDKAKEYLDDQGKSNVDELLKTASSLGL